MLRLKSHPFSKEIKSIKYIKGHSFFLLLFLCKKGHFNFIKFFHSFEKEINYFCTNNKKKFLNFFAIWTSHTTHLYCINCQKSKLKKANVPFYLSKSIQDPTSFLIYLEVTLFLDHMKLNWFSHRQKLWGRAMVAEIH